MNLPEPGELSIQGGDSGELPDRFAMPDSFKLDAPPARIPKTIPAQIPLKVGTSAKFWLTVAGSR